MTTVIEARRLLDGTGAPPREHSVVIVRDGVITDVAPAETTRIPEGAIVVTLPDDETLLPGLIDSHNHPALCGHMPDYLLRMDDPYEHLFLRACSWRTKPEPRWDLHRENPQGTPGFNPEVKEASADEAGAELTHHSCSWYHRP